LRVLPDVREPATKFRGSGSYVRGSGSGRVLGLYFFAGPGQLWLGLLLSGRLNIQAGKLQIRSFGSFLIPEAFWSRNIFWWKSVEKNTYCYRPIWAHKFHIIFLPFLIPELFMRKNSCRKIWTSFAHSIKYFQIK